jgi:hypothetical protein
MKEHGFWGCELHEDQMATMMNILSEERKKNTQLQLKSHKARGRKICTRHLYFKNKIP